MYLLIDIGNSNVVLGVYREDDLLHTWRLDADRERTGDEYLSSVRELLERDAINPFLLMGAVISSVVPNLTPAFMHVARQLTGRTCHLVDRYSFSELKIGTEFPDEIGTDRLANALAGHILYRAPLIVVDFGTATNFDVVSAEGEFLGGLILPGLRLSLDALVERADKLPKIELERPDRVIGKNTVKSMQSGILFGYAGMVDSLIWRIEEELGHSAKVIGTGGLAETLRTASKRMETVIGDLTLRGLHYISQDVGKT